MLSSCFFVGEEVFVIGLRQIFFFSFLNPCISVLHLYLHSRSADDI